MAISNEQVLGAIKKNPIVTICIVISLAVLAGVYFRGDLEAEAEKALEEKSRQGQRMANNIKNAAQLDEQLAAITAANQTITTRLVRAGDLADNLQYFYKLEAATGTKLVDLRQLTVGTRTTAKGAARKSAFEPVNYSVGVVGTFPQVLAFLRQIEHGAHYSRIISASFNLMTASASSGGLGGDGAGRSDLLTMTLSLDLLGQP